MKLFGLELKKQERKPMPKVVRCFSCSHCFTLYPARERANNYCNECSPRVV